MNYELTYDEVKKLIGDLILEITALKRDNIRLSEQIEKFNTAQTNVKESNKYELLQPREGLNG